MRMRFPDRTSRCAGALGRWDTCHMPQLLYILRAFRTGKLNQQQLIAKVQLLLTDARADLSELIAALEAEQDRIPCRPTCSTP